MRHRETLRRWSVRLGVTAAIALLWWATARDDAEWMLWRHYPAGIAALNVVGSLVAIAAAYVLGSASDYARRFVVATVVLSAIFFTIGLFELPVALFGHDYAGDFRTPSDTTWLQLSTGVNRADPELVHVHVPHSRFVGTVTGNLVEFGIPPTRYQVDVAYDKNGFRNDVDLSRADVVAIGDSFVEAAEVPRADTVAARLGLRLHATIANLGQSRYGPQQELVVLERYALPLSPKLVIWFFFGGNDLSDAERYERERRHGEAPARPGGFAARSFTRHALTALARLTTSSRRTVASAARFRAAAFTDAAGLTETIYLDFPEGPWTPHQWDLATAALGRARDVSHRTGADFLIVYIPRKLRVYRGNIQAPPGTAATEWTLNNLPDALGQWCRDREIDFLDSTTALRDAVHRGESVYIADDVHWNARGHDVVAAAIARHIRDAGMTIAGTTAMDDDSVPVTPISSMAPRRPPQ